MLQIKQSRHQSWRNGRPPDRRWKEPRPFPLEHLPVDQARQLHQFVALIDHVDQSRAEQVILFGQARAVLHLDTEIAGFSMKSYKTLRAEARKNITL